MKKILPLILVMFIQSLCWAQRVVKPKIGFTPDISAMALQRSKERAAQAVKIQQRMDKGLTYEQLSPSEKELMDEYNSPDGVSDPWSLGGGGCSWYCGASEIKIKASSTLAPQGTNTYDARNAHNGTLNTAWVEGVKGYGIGQFIEYTFGKNNPPVTSIIIFNGYVKSDKAWKDNSRIKRLKMYVNGKPYAFLDLQDSKAEQRFEVGSLQNKTGELVLKFEIMDVYKGLKWDDTVLSELYFDGTGVHCFIGGSRVMLADGKTQAIEEIKAGDKILSYNIDEGRVEEAEVLETAKAKHHNLVRYHFDNVTVTATDDHPFYVAAKGWASLNPEQSLQYVTSVASLKIGDPLYHYQNSALLRNTLIEVVPLTSCEMTYTILKLSRNNSFFVNGILVSTEGGLDHAAKSLTLNNPNK